MKKLALIFALITLPITTLLAQEDASLVKVKNSETQMPRVNTSTGKLNMLWYRQGWFIDGNAGVRLLGKTSDAADMKIGPTFNAGLGYLINEKFGLKGRVDYNKIVTTSSMQEDVQNSFALSLEGVVKLIQVFGEERPRDFALILHGGAGITAMFNPEWRDNQRDANIPFEGPGLKGTDDMFHVVIGITPQYHFNSKVSLNLDVSQFIQFKQNRTYDFSNATPADGPTGLLGVSLGLTIRFD